MDMSLNTTSPPQMPSFQSEELVVWAFIFARGGSKGLPGKNIRLLAGKPLLGWAIECAQRVKNVKKIFVSTDAKDIADVARKFQAEVIPRPAALATDNASEWLAWQHALRYVGCSDSTCPMNVFVSIPTTAPLRFPADVDSCVQELLLSQADMVVTASPARRHPAFNMLTLDTAGYAHLPMPLPVRPEQRQEAPPMYDMTTVAYASRPHFILRHHSLFCGKVRMVQIPPERAVDIDTPLDFILAEALVQARNTQQLRDPHALL